MSAELKGEERLQVYVVRRLRDILPADCEFRAIEQGVKFSGDKFGRMLAWRKLENKGVKAGTTDLHFWWRNIYLTIELKWDKNVVTAAEALFMAAIRRAGFCASAAWSAAQVETAIRAAGIPLSGTLADIDARLSVERPARKVTRKARTHREIANQAALNMLARARARGVFAA